MSGAASSFVQVSDTTMHISPRNNKIVGGYMLEQKLGSGSFAVVYKGIRVAPSSQHANTVAIKAIARTSEKLTKKVLQNLEIEIAILQTYRHKNIVCLHEVHKTEHHFYLVLEYCGGGDVQGLIRSRRAGRLSEGLTRRLMRDLAAGLKFLWGQELIHRDIKPQNLLLTGPLPLDEVDDPEKMDEAEQKRREWNYPSHLFALKIADFGFARHLQTTSLAETLCGSPLYMAPEILQHHRYDAKADLWSVGTVLFEMISGKPPFHGENHIDLLRNIQHKAVRLPGNVTVSKECVKLLRLLLDRSPLSRAGFAKFFEACDAFVALGCRGPCPTNDTFVQPACLGTIQELSNVQTDQKAPAQPTQQQQNRQPQQQTYQLTNQIVQQTQTPETGIVGHRAAISTTANPPAIINPSRATPRPVLAPLVPSPPSSGIAVAASLHPVVFGLPNELQQLPLSFNQRPTQTTSVVRSATTELATQRRTDAGSLQRSSASENSFVMVGHGPSSPINSGDTSPSGTTRLEHSPPLSPYNVHNNSQVLSTRGDYMVVKQPKGMLSTSPGTGGALMGMLTGQTRLLYDDAVPGLKWDIHVKNVTKMLAASEDVGRRAVSVAHLGDSRAFIAMKMIMTNDESSSSFISGGMEGIEEEGDSGAVTDDSSSTEIMASVRRRRSSLTDNTMHDAKDDDDAENEMPFALASECQSPPIVCAGMPTRVSTSFGKSTSITSVRQIVKPTPGLIRAHFSEALSCYIKALKMLKGAVHGAQGVERELQTLSSQRISPDKIPVLQKLTNRCQVTLSWIGDQYSGVLDRAEASNSEIKKIPMNPTDSGRTESLRIPAVEELIYNNALACGREGAVKQLLGQLEASRKAYRSAGLLAETLLMEAKLVGNDRKILEEYVDGFAARITELDENILQRSKLAGSGRSPGVVGLVGQPSVSKLNL